MPITITPPVGLNATGPGLPLVLSSSVIGPQPTGTFWRIKIALDPEGAEIVWQHEEPWITNNINVLVMGTVPTALTTRAFVPDQGVSVHALAELVTPTSVADSGALTIPWNTTAGLGTQAEALTFLSQGTSGFTATDRQLLEASERRSQVLGEPTDFVIQAASGPITGTLAQFFSRSTLDRLTLTEVTTGETCDPVRFIVDQWYHAVIVRVTTISEDLVPKTPDEQWYFPDLAVLRVFRGVDLEYRRGIHTPTFIAEKPWQWGWLFDQRNPFLGTPPDMTIAVDWRAGCCGQVFLMQLP